MIKNKFEDTVTLCKSKFIPKEDKAEIYALYTYKEEKRNLSEGSENEEENSLPFGSYKEDAPANSKYNQEEADNGPKVYEEKDYMRELICNENGEVPHMTILTKTVGSIFILLMILFLYGIRAKLFLID